VEDRYGLLPYLDLIDDFLASRTAATEFESRYLRLFKTDSVRRPDRVFQVLDELFADIDSFVSDPELRDEGDLDEAALRDRAEHAGQRLRRYL
jgi:hypothetical protein